MPKSFKDSPQEITAEKNAGQASTARILCSCARDLSSTKKASNTNPKYSHISLELKDPQK